MQVSGDFTESVFMCGYSNYYSEEKNKENRGKLANLLSGVNLDLIWGPDIEYTGARLVNLDGHWFNANSGN